MPTLTWEFRRNPSDSWSDMYRRVERFASTQPNVKDFSLVQGTLEQVFIRLSKVEVSLQQTHGPPEPAPPGQPQDEASSPGTVNAGFDPTFNEDAPLAA
ncbi:hypothetical protein AAVH_37653 [Aphelenchoides avenae]|nr:hypothetical protein AAVH_37653 [Aphelenchus avenae]